MRDSEASGTPKQTKEPFGFTLVMGTWASASLARCYLIVGQSSITTVTQRLPWVAICFLGSLSVDRGRGVSPPYAPTRACEDAAASLEAISTYLHTYLPTYGRQVLRRTPRIPN